MQKGFTVREKERPLGIMTGDRVKPVGKHSHFKVGAEIHFSRDDAAKKANADRIKRIKSLEKQISKLKGLKFE